MSYRKWQVRDVSKLGVWTGEAPPNWERTDIARAWNVDIEQVREVTSPHIQHTFMPLHTEHGRDDNYCIHRDNELGFDCAQPKAAYAAMPYDRVAPSTWQEPPSLWQRIKRWWMEQGDW